MMFVLLALAGCHTTPATFEFSDDPQTVLDNADKFVDYTFDKGKRYTAEDWDLTIDEFTTMCKAYKICEWQLFENDRERFQRTLNKFIQAVDATNDADLAARVKERYGKVMNN